MSRHPATGAIVPERQRCICPDICVDHCRACNYSGRDLEEPCIADPDWTPDDDDLARREHTVSRVEAIEAAEDHADQVIFDAWRERGL